MTTVACRQSPWALLVALDGDGEARGSLYLDDGESVAPNATTWVTVSTHPKLYGFLCLRKNGIHGWANDDQIHSSPLATRPSLPGRPETTLTLILWQT